MTLPFYEKVVNDGGINTENFKCPRFVGFLNPYGIPIKFVDKFGYTGHGEVPSIQEYFRVYYILKIKPSKLISPLEEYIMSYEYLNSEKNRYNITLKECIEELKEDINRYKKSSSSFVISRLQMNMDVYSFLFNCYSANTFFEGVGNIETCMCKEEFWNKEYINKNLYRVDSWDFNIEYEIYKDKILTEIFKNVMIQNLGYHSIERVPRTITTSSLNIYETFYNYLLNDFLIFQMPKIIFDPKKKKYVKQNLNEFFLPDSELRLRDEIQAIKKLVPIKEREKYYR